MFDSKMFNELPAEVFVSYIMKTDCLDDKSKQIIQSKLIECEMLISKNNNELSFNNWSNFINAKISKYTIYYHNYVELVPRLLSRIWNKLTDKRKELWIDDEYTDNYPYILILFDYTESECDIIHRSYNSYMEEREFYLQFNLIISRLILTLSKDNLYLLSYLFDDIIIHMQRRIIKMCKSSKEIRHKIIKLLVAYKQNACENAKIYTINLLKKLVYYDRHGGLISLNVTFNEKQQIKYIEKVQY
jgi:hypothetical protein